MSKRAESFHRKAAKDAKGKYFFLSVERTERKKLSLPSGPEAIIVLFNPAYHGIELE